MQSGVTVKLLIEGMLAWYNAYSAWFDHYGQSPPPFHPHGVIVTQVVGDGPIRYKRPIAGALIYESEGPFAIVDRVATNPLVNARLRHEALVAGAEALATYGMMRSKVMMCLPNSKGLEKVLERVGFKHENVRVMTIRPSF